MKVQENLFSKYSKIITVNNKSVMVSISVTLSSTDFRMGHPVTAGIDSSPNVTLNWIR